MNNLWQIITGNSTLSIATSNNLWDHLNNQQGGGNSVEVGAIKSILSDEHNIINKNEQVFIKSDEFIKVSVFDDQIIIKECE